MCLASATSTTSQAFHKLVLSRVFSVLFIYLFIYLFIAFSLMFSFSLSPPLYRLYGGNIGTLMREIQSGQCVKVDSITLKNVQERK